MLELERFSTTLMVRRRSSPSNRRSNNAHKSRRSTEKRNPRKRQRNHRFPTLKPSLSSQKVCGFRRSYEFRKKQSKSSFTFKGMPSKESSVRNFWSHRRQRSKHHPHPRKCGGRKCHRHRLHPVTTSKPKEWRVRLRTLNPRPRHEVRGTYPSLHCILDSLIFLE